MEIINLNPMNVKVLPIRHKTIATTGMALLASLTFSGNAIATTESPPLPSKINIEVAFPDQRLGGADNNFSEILGFGIPFKKGVMSQSDLLNTRVTCTQAEQEEDAPSHQEVKNVWSDGSVRWAWVEYQWSPEYSGCELNLAPQQNPRENTLQGGITIENMEDNSITINTGKIRLAFNNTSLFPQNIEQSSSQISEPILNTSILPHFYLKDSSDCDPSDCTTTSKLIDNVHWKVERDSPLRIIITGRANYVTESDAILAEAQVRFTLKHNSDIIDIEHTLFNIKEEIQYRELGIMLEPTDQFELFASSQERAENTLTTENSSLTTSPFIFWSTEDEEYIQHVDYKLRSILDSFPKAYVQTISEMTDFNSPEDVINHYKEKPFHLGTARTHKLRISFPPQGSDNTAIENYLLQTLISPHLAYIDPEYITHVDNAVFPVMATYLQGVDYNKNLEDLRSQWFDHYLEQSEWYPLSGWYDYGRVPYNRFMKNPSQSSEGNFDIYPNWYRQTISHYHIVRNSIFSWARSGDRKYIDFARKANRHTRDFHFSHKLETSISNAPHFTGQYLGGKDSRFPFYWTKPALDVMQQISDGEDLSSIMYEYFLFDDLASFDTLKGYQDFIYYHMNRYPYPKNASPVEQRDHIKKYYFTSTPFPSMSAMLSTHKALTGRIENGQVVHETKIRDALEEFLPHFYSQHEAFALSPDYWQENYPGHNNLKVHYKLDRKLSALLDAHYYFHTEPASSDNLNLSLLPQQLANVYLTPESDATFAKGVFVSQSLAPMFNGIGYQATCNQESKAALEWNLSVADALFQEMKDHNVDFKSRIDDMPTENNTSGWFAFKSQYLQDNHDIGTDTAREAEYHIEPSRNAYMLYALPIAVEYARNMTVQCLDTSHSH
ncbi:hypothetical protein ACJJIQ_14995 [Microbulbifer sp. ANSA003]|uniref:hypothetical protein n=1 Tax=Microbulbifer sp. ANSA003 TaxID=3243360 RepID=UPI0040425523